MYGKAKSGYAHREASGCRRLIRDRFHGPGGFPMLVDSLRHPENAPAGDARPNRSEGAALRTRARRPSPRSSTRWRSGARPRRCAATCRASGLAALMTEFCGSGCRPEGACNRPSRRSCGLSAPIHLTSEYCASPKSPGKIWGEPSRDLRTILRNARPSWSGPRFDKRGEIHGRPQPIFLKVWLRIIEAYSRHGTSRTACAAP